MEILKVIGIGIVGAIIVALLKNSKGELAVFASIATGAIILIIVVGILSGAVESIGVLVTKTGINSSLFSGVLKIIGIGYLSEYSANICDDIESKSIGNKVRFAGKAAIFVLALPILNSLLELIIGIVQ